MIRLIDQAAIGRPITRGEVSFFPVFINQRVPTMGTGAAGGVHISERDDAEVPTLQVTNTSGVPVPLVEGETVTGGLQDRVLNVSVLVPAGATIDLPVSCVEQGRWSGGTAFARGTMHATRRVLRAKSTGVAANVRASGAKHSDQGDVWSAVRFELQRVGGVSATGNFDGVGRALTARDDIAVATDEMVGLGPLAGQCGIVVAHGSRVVAADVFATPDMLACHWAAIVRSHLVDAPDEARGRPSATRALEFLHRFAAGTGEIAPGVGLGREHHITTRRLVGQALLWDDVLVHASAFALAA
jgi:hypothetical protein